jgi:demethylmenaquinone methyltransferase/2-methoxy-6-polyprenyl-1,4-benzoquinol methylase
MVEQGRRRHPELEFVHADAMDLPFEDNSFDACTISFGLRNIADPSVALRQMLRVTKPGGRLVVCEFSTPRLPGAGTVYRRGLATVLPRVASRVSSNPQAYEYLAASIADWPDQHELAALISASGWTRVRWRNLTGGIVALHGGMKAVEPHLDRRS